MEKSKCYAGFRMVPAEYARLEMPENRRKRRKPGKTPAIRKLTERCVKEPAANTGEKQFQIIYRGRTEKKRISIIT